MGKPLGLYQKYFELYLITDYFLDSEVSEPVYGGIS